MAVGGQDYNEDTCAILGTVVDGNLRRQADIRVIIAALNMTQMTDADGQFVFRFVPSGTYVVAVFDSGVREEAECVAGRASEPVTLVLSFDTVVITYKPIVHGVESGSRSGELGAPWPPSSEATPERACSTTGPVKNVHFVEQPFAVINESGGNSSQGPVVKLPVRLELNLTWEPPLAQPASVPDLNLCLVGPSGEVRAADLGLTHPAHVRYLFGPEDPRGAWKAIVFLSIGAKVRFNFSYEYETASWFEAALRDTA